MNENKYVVKNLHWNIATDKSGNSAELTAEFRDDVLQNIVVRGRHFGSSVMFQKDEARDCLIGLKVAVDELDKIVNG